MRDLFTRLRKTEPDKEASQRLLALERDLQSQRLELAARDQLVEDLESELQRQRTNSEALLAERSQAQMTGFLEGLAAPAAQLITQIHLVEEEGKQIPIWDVVAVARRLVRTLQENGLATLGVLGERVPFDPDQHVPLSAEDSPQSGDSVVVRFVGFTYQGRLLRKAGVSPNDTSDDRPGDRPGDTPGDTP